MTKKLRKIALVLSIAAVLFTTGPEVAQVRSQVANAQIPSPEIPKQGINIDKIPDTMRAEIVNKAILLFGVNLTSGKESPTFIQNVTQLAKDGFDSPENAKLFLQLDSIAFILLTPRECYLNNAYD